MPIRLGTWPFVLIVNFLEFDQMIWRREAPVFLPDRLKMSLGNPGRLSDQPFRNNTGQKWHAGCCLFVLIFARQRVNSPSVLLSSVMSYPSTLSPRPSGFLAPKARIKRREPSGVFTLFQAAQIQQFKEAFSLIDQDGDGIVSESDLKGIFSSLGELIVSFYTRWYNAMNINVEDCQGVSPSRHTLQSLLDARPGEEGGRMSILPSEMSKTRGVNFTMFLTMMGEHLLELDGEADLIEAFACFDENDDGKVKCDEIRKWLSEVGDRMDPHEVCLLFASITIDTHNRSVDRPLVERTIHGPARLLQLSRMGKGVTSQSRR